MPSIVKTIVEVVENVVCYIVLIVLEELLLRVP